LLTSSTWTTFHCRRAQATQHAPSSTTPPTSRESVTDADGPDTVRQTCHRAAVRSLPAPSPAAFTVEVHDDRRAGAALLLHGYTGTPYEVRVLGDDLVDRLGLAVHAPLLPGHGDDPAVLNRLSWQDWLDAAVAGFDRLDGLDPTLPGGGRRPRVVVGSSMGGLLALQLCRRRAVDAVVLLAPALRFHEAATVGIAALSAGLWRLRPFLPKEGPGGDVAAADAARVNPTYKIMPTRGITELFALQWQTERILAEITTPLCVFHGELDQTIAPSSSRIIARRVSSPVVEHHRLRRSRHLVGLDLERDRVSELAVAFVSHTLFHASSGPPPRPMEAS
jgi:carboxylesterase